MKIRLFCYLFLFLSYASFSQTNDHKYWKDGELEWSDFQVTYTNYISGSELSYIMGFSPEKSRHGDTIIFRYGAIAYIDRSKSWVHAQLKNDVILDYNCVIFDLLELYRRKIQFELERLKSPLAAEPTFRTLFNLFTDRVHNFRTQAEYGKNTLIINQWKAGVREELLNYPEEYLPPFEKRNFGYGMNFGIGSGFFTNSLNEHFTPAFNFMYGFDLAIKRSIFYINASLGWNKIKTPFSHRQENWLDTNKTGVAILDLSYGYAFIDNAKIKLTPFAGFGLTEFTTRTKDQEIKGNRMTDWNVTGGVNFDYKLRKVLKLHGNMYLMREHVERSLRARLYITKAYFSPEINGYTVNLTVGYNVFGNGLKIRQE